MNTIARYRRSWQAKEAQCPTVRLCSMSPIASLATLRPTWASSVIYRWRQLSFWRPHHCILSWLVSAPACRTTYTLRSNQTSPCRRTSYLCRTTSHLAFTMTSSLTSVRCSIMEPSRTDSVDACIHRVSCCPTRLCDHLVIGSVRDWLRETTSLANACISPSKKWCG
jgi:hypothetical protein